MSLKSNLRYSSVPGHALFKPGVIMSSVAGSAVAPTTLLSFLYNLYLFTRSDFKTILFPITIFGIVASPRTTSGRLPHTFAWVWLNLLQFCVSNQSLSVDEDLANKPWRPIPAMRMSLADAKRLRWLLLPLCLTLSFCYPGAMLPGVALAFGIFIHNELYFDSHWLTRNVCNALGYAAFNSGATYVACDTACSLNGRTVIAHAISSLVVLTTIHAQDFEDMEGDRIRSRKTLPLVFPTGSRIIMVVGLPLWSAFLCQYWHIGTLQSVMISALGGVLSLRYLCLRSKSSDRVSYVLYNIWLCLAQLLPFICDDAAG